jgi:phosphopantothenoylcysteine synthetase/decarboxylase
VEKHLMLVITGAPLAARTPDIVAEVLAAEWSITVVATHSALAWIDAETVKRVTGHDVYVDYRRPGQQKRAPEPDALVVCPATFNTINKAAQGIADNYATGAICAAIGEGLPVIIFPMINHRLWKHPSRSDKFEALKRAGVAFRDLFSGLPGAQPAISGTGDAAVDRFKPAWVIAALR